MNHHCEFDNDSLRALSQVIVVEGLHDKQAVLRAVQADVWVLGGDRIRRETLDELRRAAQRRGLVVLTDPDGPGERIRRRIALAIPDALHAFIAKGEALGAGSVGVEHAKPESIQVALSEALKRHSKIPALGAGPGEVVAARFELDDLRQHGLVGAKDSAHRRSEVGERLGIGYANAKSFVWKLNALCVTRDEWDAAIEFVNGRENDYDRT